MAYAYRKLYSKTHDIGISPSTRTTDYFNVAGADQLIVHLSGGSASETLDQFVFVISKDGVNAATVVPSPTQGPVVFPAAASWQVGPGAVSVGMVINGTTAGMISCFVATYLAFGFSVVTTAITGVLVEVWGLYRTDQLPNPQMTIG